jgi:hypothetical protein
MRIHRFVRRSGLVGAVCLATLLLSLLANAKTVTQPISYSKQVQFFLGDVQTPVLFIGKLLDVDTSILPCTIANTRGTKWSVSKVLYGFNPGSPVNIDFLSCGGLEPQYKTHDEMLVIAYPAGYHGIWMGMPQSVVSANNDNVRAAEKAMDDYLRSRIRLLIRPPRVQRSRPILVFTGTILDPGPQRGDEPCVSTVPPTFPMKFQIAQLIRGDKTEGDKTEKEVTLQFPGCGVPQGSPFRAGEPVIAFALQVQPSPPNIFRMGFLLPLAQLAEAQKALQAVEASLRPPTDRP